MPDSTAVLIAVLVLLVAALYSSVGHAGASGYLGVMALFAFDPAVAKPTATTLNVFVAAIGTVQFARAGHVPWRLVLTFLAGSVPLAFVGGKMTLPDDTYKRVVGVVLLCAAARLAVGTWPTLGPNARRPSVVIAVALGAAVGLLSGLTGTGGGIFLTPFLILFRWADPKPAAGASVVFILANSVAGLAGQLQAGVTYRPEMPVWVAAAVAGGLVGSHFGARRFGGATLRRLLAAMLVLAGGKLVAGVGYRIPPIPHQARGASKCGTSTCSRRVLDADPLDGSALHRLPRDAMPGTVRIRRNPA